MFTFVKTYNSIWPEFPVKIEMQCIIKQYQQKIEKSNKMCQNKKPKNVYCRTYQFYKSNTSSFGGKIFYAIKHDIKQNNFSLIFYRQFRTRTILFSNSFDSEHILKAYLKPVSRRLIITKKSQICHSGILTADFF